MQDEKPPMKKLPTSMLPEETAPRPEFPEQEQTPPGLDAEMEPSRTTVKPATPAPGDWPVRKR